MSDLTAPDHGHSEDGSHGPVGTSDDDLNAELDADMAEALAADHDDADDLAERAQQSERDAGAGI